MKSLLSLFALICAAAMPLGAAVSTPRTLKDAMKQASARKPVVAFCYGANYDRVSEHAYTEFIKKRGLKRALGPANFALVCVPIYQLPNEKEQKEASKAMGGAGFPGGLWRYSFPCLVVIDSAGRVRGSVQTGEEMKTPETAAAALNVLLKDFKRQEGFLVKASRASGKRKEHYLAEASEFSTNMPTQANIDHKKVYEDMEVMAPEAAYAYIRKKMSENLYSRRQRQELLAAYSGHLRRHGATASRLRAVYTEMRNIDPKSIYAVYAEGAIELWVEPREQNPALEEAATKKNPNKGGSSGGKSAMGATSIEDA